MDIVWFWKQQIDLWNEENKCGLCWNFHAPLVPSQINIVQKETCCVNVFLTDVRFKEDKVVNPVTGLITSKRQTWTCTLHAMMPKDLGVNNYNEIKGYPVEESKWNEIFYPIINCLSTDNLIDTCEVLGYKMNVLQNGDAVLVHNYLDDNYNGWRITYSFSENT